MTTNSNDLSRRPKADAIKVEDLVQDALRGRIRIPSFQRALKWEPSDVRDLLDSVYRGYPIGNLLLWARRDSPDEPVRLGPLLIRDPEPTGVRWVVDGQQRITSLASSLTKRGAEDPLFAVWFDPDEGSFHLAPSEGPSPHWVEVWRLLDAAELGEFLYDWGPGRHDPDRRRALLEAGKRIREYSLPVYIIEADDVRVLREIFRRVNATGQALAEADVFNALVGSPEQGLEQVSVVTQRAGWGMLQDGTLLMAVKGIRGRDPTRSEDETATRELEDDLKSALELAARAFEHTIRFMREDAGIPHRRLLPYRVPLVVLARFFALFPRPSSYTRRMLVRWVWRGFLTGVHYDSEKVRLRASVRAVREDPEQSARRLLALVPAGRTRWETPSDKNYDARAAIQRIGLLGLASLAPSSLEPDTYGDTIAVGELLDAAEAGAMRRIFTHNSAEIDERYSRLANRVIHPKVGRVRELLVTRAQVYGVADPVLLSHAIEPETAVALLQGDHALFLERREATIETVVNRLAEHFADWDRPATPSIRAALGG